MQQRTLGTVQVGAIGLGAMPMSVEGSPDADQSIATIHAALDAGVTLIDTADAYHAPADETGHNELLVAAALRAYGGDTDHVVIATKGGHTRPSDGSWEVDGRPEHLHAAARASLTRLGVEAIGLYQFHRPDPAVPYAESVGVLAELLDEGLIRMAGISNADPDQIAIAQEVLGGRLTSVQNQFSPTFLTSAPELRLCADQGIAFLPWSPLGGIGGASELGGAGAAFAELAERYDVSPQRVCLAWHLSLAPVVIPIPGSSRPESITDSAQATELTLTAEEVDAISAVLRQDD